LEIIDAQLHDFGPRRNWGAIDKETRHGVMTELMLAWMDAVGVDKALVFPTDDEWTKAAITENPDRFAGVYKIANPEGADVAEQVAESRNWPKSLGLRLSFGRLPTDPEGKVGSAKLRAGAFDAFFAACQHQQVPLFCSAYGYVHLVGDIAEAFPNLQLIVDHMGIAQPPLNPRVSPPWKGLDDLIPLARYPNVAVKMTGAPVLSERTYPFADIWGPLRGMIDAFGAGRIMWASDTGRFMGRIGWDNLFPEAHSDYDGRHTYAESLFFVLHSDSITADEKRMLLGGTVRQLLNWHD